MSFSAKHWIEKLKLVKHPEGGYYAEIYRSPFLISPDSIPFHPNSSRNSCTQIFFLIEASDFSAFHRIKSDEQWHFYYGDALVIYEITTSGELKEHKLGDPGENNQGFTCNIPGGSWFGASVLSGGQYALVGCTVSPGFDFEDFELGNRSSLYGQFPQHGGIIERLTRS